MTPNSLAVLKSRILDENYVTVMHVPLSTPVENTFCHFISLLVKSSILKEKYSYTSLFVVHCPSNSDSYAVYFIGSRPLLC